MHGVINLKDEYQQAIVTMGDSGIAWIDLVFRVCVFLLVEFAKIIGITYEELNVFLFVIIFPAVIIISLFLLKSNQVQLCQKTITAFRNYLI